MNSDMEDVGVLQSYSMDLAFGTDENDFECIVATSTHCCEAGFFLYLEGTEYGGIIDSIKVNTDSKEVTYCGRTWHGILDSKVLEPDANQDYLILSGEANAVLATLLVRMGLTALFQASSDISGINISNYKMNRYIGGYEGIRKMLKASGAKLNMSFEDGHVILSANEIVDYSQDEQFDEDQVAFNIKRNYMPVNHCICLGQGDLHEREVIHLYADSSGNISHTQSLTGLAEVTAVYDCSNAESTEELEKGGIELIQDSWNSNEVNFDFNANETLYDIGDVIGAAETITGVIVEAEITKKIVTIDKGQITINYKVGE